MAVDLSEHTAVYSPGMDVCTRVIVRWLLSCETRSVSSAGWRRSGRCEWACVRHGARLRFCDILVYFVHAVIASCRRLSSAVVVSRRTAAHNTQCRLHRTLAGLPVPRFVSAVFLKYNTDVSHCTCSEDQPVFNLGDFWQKWCWKSMLHTHTPFNGPFSGTTQVSRYWYQKGKTNLDFSEARDSEWQWHQLGHMQVCTSHQADNHASTPPLSFLQAGCPSCRPTNSVKALSERACYHMVIFFIKIVVCVSKWVLFFLRCSA